MQEAKTVYLVQWIRDRTQCAEVFRDYEAADTFARHVGGGAYVTSVALRGMEYVYMVFGPSA